MDDAEHLLDPEHEVTSSSNPTLISPDLAEESNRLDSEEVLAERNLHILPLVGIGGSAGSIPVLQTFFAHTPADTGMVFVVIMHLSSEHESSLASILQHSTQMPVVQVQQKTEARANTVYIIPPGKLLSMTDGHLDLSELDRAPGKRVTVDLFFRTLADTHGSRAMAIVLSGADSDGAIGIKRIKERGGLTIVQDPMEAQFDGMPRAAIATGMIDWVLPVKEIPKRLVTYRENEKSIKLPSIRSPRDRGPESKVDVDGESALQDVLSYLRVSTGRDFSYYKRATILRRVGRRMQVNGVTDLPDYLSFLRVHPGETGALLQDLLISVTNFFRDRTCFQSLELMIPKFFDNKGPSDQVRVWVTACATGEEAYSIAMLLTEYAAQLSNPPRIQVFATDIDEEAIRMARDAIYPETIAADVSEERLRRFFSLDHGHYRVKRALRETVLFAPHDLLKDSPFSRLDLVSCRNLLIYLNRAAQNRAFEIFHFALRLEGRLFLGTSESVEENGSLFVSVDKKNRIYSRRAGQRAGFPISSGITSLTQSLHRDRWSEMRSITPNLSPAPRQEALTGGPANAAPPPLNTYRELHHKLMERVAPASVLIDQNHEIIHLSERADRFLHFTGGEPTMNLIRVVNPMLRLDLRTALFRAEQTKGEVELPGIRVEIEGKTRLINISVEPGADLMPGYFLVVFREQETPLPLLPVPTTENETMAHLEEELEQVKGQLRDTIEQYEAGSEELKASNEELQAMNEELRSATEELETGREELQSINEELMTVNQELKSKIDEVSRSNNDVQNLMSATNIATIFLDRDLCIKRYTPTSIALFNFIPTDLGRPLSDLTPRLDYPTMAEDAKRVLTQLILIEREMRSAEGNWFLARLLPYRTAEDQIAGVVLTFVDITHRKQVEDALRASQGSLAEELKAMADLHEMTTRVLKTSDLKGALHEVLYATTQLHGTDLGSVHLYDAASHKLNLVASCGFGPAFGQTFGTLDPNDRSPYARALTTSRRVIVENYGLDQPSSPEQAAQAISLGYQAVQAMPLMTRGGELLGIMSTHFREPHHLTDPALQRADLYARQAADLIERKRAEEALRESEDRIRAIVSQTTAGISETDLDGRLTFVNRKFCTLLNSSEEELLGKNMSEILYAEDKEKREPAYQRLLQDGVPIELEARFHRKGGTLIWVSVSLTTTRNEAGQPEAVLSSVADLTERIRVNRELQQALQENEKARVEIQAAASAKDHFLAVLSHELRTPLTPVLMTVGSLSRRTDLPERVRDGLEMIRRNVQIESHFIDDLLDVTRITRSKFEIVRNPMDVHEAIRNAIQISEADLQAKQQDITVNLRAERHSITGDSTRVEQVIWNLIKNSSKFTPEKGRIEIESRNENDKILIIVQDNGIGIEAEILPHIFEAFAQGGVAVTREYGGLGLGLAISKATVDAHGGTLEAKSLGRNQGAIFTVTLPLS